ncbi:MAG: hypothetical protein ACRDXX_12145 [Stackebrandtia sp.]
MTNTSDTVSGGGSSVALGKSPRRRAGRLLVLATLAAVAVGAVTAVFVFGVGDDNAGLDSCPPERPPTGKVDPEPAPDAPTEQLRVVDSGFAPSVRSETSGATERSTFGFILENESDLVLYDAYVSLRLVDADGEDPTEGFTPSQLEENAYYLDSVHVPALLPGQQVGMGGMVVTWVSLAEDPETGDGFKPDPVDYDALGIEVVEVDGEWWTPDNDVRHFVDVAPAEAERVDAGPEVEFTYLDGTPGANPQFEYDVDSPHCDDLAAYPPTAVAYNADGDIVGGNISLGTSDEPELTYPPGVNRAADSLDLLAPEGDLTVSVFPYPAPATPVLTRE